MERSFSLSPADANVAFNALRYYAADMFEAFIEDDESELLDEAVDANELAQQLQAWLVAGHQSLVHDTSS